MDIQRFATHTAQSQPAPLHHDEPSTHLVPSQWAALLESLRGTMLLTQVLKVAVGCMEPGDVYCEIGCLPGANLIAALLNHPECMAYAVEDLARVDAEPDAIEQLTEKLAAFSLDEQVFFCDQPFEAFFNDLQQMASEDRIGVYFYNEKADYRSVILGLMLAAPFLSDQALIVIAQAHLGTVQQATWDFLASYPQAHLLIALAADADHTKTDSNSFLVLGWSATKLPEANQFDWHRRDRAVIDAIYHLPAYSNLDLEALRKDAVQLHVEGQLTKAEQKYRLILQSDPQNAEIWLNLGMLYYLAENSTAAIEALQRSLSINPSHALTHHITGLTFERVMRFDEARAAYEHAISLNPNYGDALNRLGSLYLQADEWSQAEELFRRAIAANADNFLGYQNLGDALAAQEQHQAAIEIYKQALSRKRRDPDILQKLGDAFRESGDLASAHNYLAYASYRRGDHEDAIEAFQKFFELSAAGNVTDYLTLHDCYYHCGQMQPAIECLHAIARLKPDDQFLDICPQLILPTLYQTAAEVSLYREQVIQGYKTVAQRVTTAREKGEKINIAGIQYFTNFYLSFQGQNDRDLQATYGQLVQQHIGAHYPEWLVPRSMPPVSEAGKIRIGYLADNIGNNSATRWAIGWLKNHDRSKFEIYCYNIGSISDRRTEQFKTLSDRFYHIPDNLEATAKQIIADELHVLVFLAIGTWAPTAHLASLRLAPVQCSAWGHPVTSGFSTIDYFLSGDLMEPDNAQEHYTEQLIRLPNLGFSYPKPLMSAPTFTRADFGLREDAVIYLSCQLLFKYLPQHDHLFPEIARRVPNAQLVFVLRSAMTQRSNIHLEQQFRQRLERAFADVGLQSDDYCVFLPGQDWERYTSLLAIADVFLDTLSFSGGHTTFDAIARHLPVVTCPGEVMRGRQSYGALKLLGVTETIAQTEAEYVEIAARLGLEPEWKQAIAQRMSDRHQHLFDDTACVAGLEQFYQQVVAAKLTPQATSPLPLPAALIRPDATKFVLHVGCGPHDPETLPEQLRSQAWQEVRLDINPDVQPDIVGSMTDMSAVPSESVDAIYSSHNLEHLYAHEVPIALAEFCRVLKPGGFVLVVVPDVQAIATVIAQGNLEDTLYESDTGAIAAIDILFGLRSAIAAGNHFMAHRTAFTAKSLQEKLLQAGLSNIESHKDGLNLWQRGYK